MEGWRPRNETAADRARQDAARAAVERAFHCRAIDLSPSLYEVDWALMRGDDLVAWGEYKNRATRYSTVMLSFAKWERGCGLARAGGVPFIFVVEWPDGLYWARVDGLALKAKSGHNSRGQRGDEEPVVYIDSALFGPVNPNTAS